MMKDVIANGQGISVNDALTITMATIVTANVDTVKIMSRVTMCMVIVLMDVRITGRGTGVMSVLIIITMQTVQENAVIASTDKFVIKLTDIVRMGAIFISILLCAKNVTTDFTTVHVPESVEIVKTGHIVKRRMDTVLTDALITLNIHFVKSVSMVFTTAHVHHNVVIARIQRHVIKITGHAFQAANLSLNILCAKNQWKANPEPQTRIQMQ